MLGMSIINVIFLTNVENCFRVLVTLLFSVHVDLIILLYLQTGIHLNSHSFYETQFVTHESDAESIEDTGARAHTFTNDWARGHRE